MNKIEIIAAGQRWKKTSPLRPLWDDYCTRLAWPLTLHEIEGRNAAEEHKKILEKIDNGAFLFVLDETGKDLRSIDFARKLEDLSVQGQGHAQFVIGGADGVSQEIRNKAGFLLSLGKQTWPHMLVRVMLAEQLYRACQIQAGHPYHRES